MSIRATALSIVCLCSLSAFAAERPQTNWVGTWAAAPMACPVRSDEPSAGDMTHRNIVRISIGGRGFRALLTNEFGASQLIVGSAHIAMSAGSGMVQPRTDHVLTFSGHTSVTIPSGGFVLSDEVAMEAPALSSLTISIYTTAQEISIRSCHLLASSTNYAARGDVTGAVTFKNARAIESWTFVKGIEVRANQNASSIVALGDSITDGYASTKDASHRWPDYLAMRLQKRDRTSRFAVLNEGIIGNRLLRSEWGQSAIARLDRDVIAQSGGRYLVLLEGINDLDWSDASQDATLEDLTLGITQLVKRAHAHGLSVFAATLTPYGGADGFSEKGEVIRVALNNWYRSGCVVDGVIDFDNATRNPKKPSTLNPAYDSGDHLHPNDAGYEAMANAIDVSLFR